MIKQTAGRENLGEFAPKFAELNDDVLFGEVWSREDRLSTRDRSMVTLCVLMGKGIADSSLRYHLQAGRLRGRRFVSQRRSMRKAQTPCKSTEVCLA